MRLKKKSFLNKLVGVVRFLFVRFIFIKSFKTSCLAMIGSRCKFFINKGGKVFFDGRVIIGDDCEIQSTGLLRIGDHCVINPNTRIVSFEEITIGDNVTIARLCTILDHDHGYKIQDGELVLDGYSTKSVTIGNNVWLGEKVTVLKGCSIGSNVIVAAQTLVNKDIPSNSVVAGVPCKIIRDL